MAMIGYLLPERTNAINHVQALWVAEVLRGRVVLPSWEKIGQVAEKRKQVIKAYESGPGGNLCVEDVEIIDELLEDIGIETYRKENYYRDLFKATTSTEYESVMTERI